MYLNIMKVDLHIHTTASDGCWDPTDLIQEIKKAGIGLFAVTDHDSIGSVELTSQLAKDACLGFIRGVEFTVKYDGKICHILGYGIDPNNPEIIKLCIDNTRRMRELNLDQVKQIIKDGIHIDFEEYKEYKFDKKRGGGMLTNYLIDKGHFKNFKESLTYVAKTVKWTTPDYLSPEEVIKIIKQASGHPILAHPGSTLLSGGLSDKELDRLIEMGIEGLECFTNYHDEELTDRFLKFCKDRNLLLTAGSDCHGPLLEERVLGKPSAELDQLNLGPIWP